MKPMLRQGDRIHRERENGCEHDPVIEGRPIAEGRKQKHRASSGRELHKAFHPGTIPHTNLSRKRPVDRPAIDTNAFRYGRLLDSCFSAPLSDGQASPCVSQDRVGAPIVGLLSLRRPLAICLGVGAVVIDALKRAAGRSISHIGGETREIIPSRADINPARPVVRECRVSGSQTPCTHVAPRLIERVAGPTDGRTVDGGRCNPIFETQATTRSRGTGSQVFAVDNGPRAAVANAFPAVCISPVWGLNRHEKSAKSLASQIKFSCHTRVYGELEYM